MTTALIFLAIDQKRIAKSELSIKTLNHYATLNLKLQLPQFKHLKVSSDMSPNGEKRVFYVTLSKEDEKKLPANTILPTNKQPN